MKKRLRDNFLIGIFFLVIACLYVYLFARTKLIFSAGDMMFHANRMEELFRDVQHGVLIPRISTYTFNQVGSGINFFYPWIFLYPFVIFRLITGNPIMAFYLGVILETFLTLAIAYYSMHQYSHSKTRSLVFALIYTLANYRLYLVFNQNVLAESIGYTFVPLVLLGFYEVFFSNQQKWPLFGIGMTLLIYSHMLTTALTASFLLLTFLIFLPVIQGKGKRLLSAVKAAGLSLALTAFFLVPFFEQTLTNHLRASWKGFNYVALPMHVIENSLNNAPWQVIGFVLLLTLTFGFLGLKHAPAVEKFSYFSGLVLVLLTTTLFPWDKLLGTPIANLQFPYRLNGLATVMLSIYLSLLIEQAIRFLQSHYHVSSYLSIFVILAGLMCLTVSASEQIISWRSSDLMIDKRPTVNNYYLQNKNVNGCYNLRRNNWQNQFYYYGHNGAFDYFPVNIKADGQLITSIVTHHALVDGRKVNLTSRLTSKPNAIRYDLSGLKAGSTVQLPILFYHNDVVKIGNSDYRKPMVSNSTTVVVKVPQTHKQVTVKYQDSLLDVISVLVSVLAWLVVAASYLYRKLHRRKDYERIS